MFNSNTDRAWEQFGRDDPYFGVLTKDRFRKNNITDNSRQEFFESGYRHVNRLVETIKVHIDPNFTATRALDFGCGVGRIVIPLASVADHVVGADVSESMLREAKRNCSARSMTNIDFIKSDDRLSNLDGKFNLIHSFIVFQHIPVRRGEFLFGNLLEFLDDGGICAIHVTYDKRYPAKKLAPWIKEYIPLSKHLVNLAKGRRLLSPQMQMNSYCMNRLLAMLQKARISEFHAQFTDHEGVLGAVLFFRKPCAEPNRHGIPGESALTNRYGTGG